MARGSYFTIYRTDSSKVLSPEKLEEVKKQYIANHKAHHLPGLDGDAADEEKSAVPLLVDEDFKAGEVWKEGDRSFKPVFSSKTGIAHWKLLSFSFTSYFIALKDHYGMSYYDESKSDIIVSAEDAKQMLMAAKYILGKKYDRAFEELMANSFVEELGESIYYFRRRFSKGKEPIYIDKEESGYAVRFGDDECSREAQEEDSWHEGYLKTLIACLSALFEADDVDWRDSRDEIVLVYSVWG